MEDKCIICGAVIPEGRQVCRRCEVMGSDPVVVDADRIPGRSRVRSVSDRDRERE